MDGLYNGCIMGVVTAKQAPDFGALCSFSGIFVALVAVLLAFKGQDLSQRAVRLAEWTALKDFWEYCTTIKVSIPHLLYM
jgi:hypothetical protein